MKHVNTRPLIITLVCFVLAGYNAIGQAKVTHNPTSITANPGIQATDSTMGTGANKDKGNAGNLTIIGAATTSPGGDNRAMPSDLRVKKDVYPYNDGLTHIMQINPVRFKYNGKGKTPLNNKEYIGIIAQDIQKIAPYTITETDKKIDVSGKGMLELTDGGAFTYMLINAVKDQQKQIEKMQILLVAMAKEISTLKAANVMKK